MNSPKSEFAEYIELMAFIRWRGSRLTTTTDVMKKFGWSEQSSRHLLRNLRAVGLIGIKHAETPTDSRGVGGSYAFHYGLGDDLPEWASRKKVGTRIARAKRFAELWRLLSERAYTITEVADTLCVHYGSIHRAIEWGRSDGRRIFRISKWDRPHDNTRWVAHYSVGWQTDAPKPEAMSRQVREARRNERRKFAKATAHRVPNSVFDLARVAVTSQPTV